MQSSSKFVSTMAIVGCGVIGAGWAARALSKGLDVRAFDPDPEGEAKLRAAIANAWPSLERVGLRPRSSQDRLTYCNSVASCVAGAGFIQENAPEREALKQDLLAEIDEAGTPDAVIASSTSGLLPTVISRKCKRAERVVVGHPFNPVYLLPLVEVCGGARTSPDTIARAREVYAGVGMRPLVLQREIDGFVADRLMEALWREALWLVHDGVATAEQIDDAIRFGAGLRWSFMGTFLVYRIAGGEAGMRHFMAQFGPALKWPWTKLMDVPELTDELLDTIVGQSDAQARGRSIRELEALRDDCLVAVMQGLRSVGFAAGETLADYERILFSGATPAPVDPTRPIRVGVRRVPADWADYNGHMNDSRYMQLSSEALDDFFRQVGMSSEYLASGRSFYTVESHVRYLGESKVGDEIAVTAQVVALDAKRVHLHSVLTRRARHAGDSDTVVATAEHLYLHVDTRAKKSSPIGGEILARLRPIAEAHARLPRPEGVGRHVGQPRD